MFAINRLKKGKQLRKASDVKEVEKNIHLIKSPAGTSFTPSCSPTILTFLITI